MPALANVVISKVYKGASGVNKYGPWQAYNFYVEGRDERFGYFQSKDKPVPVVGMVLEVMTYETKVRGEYTNHDVGIMELAKDQPVQAGQPAESGGTQSVITSNGNGRDNKKGIKIQLQGCLKVAIQLPNQTMEKLKTDAADLFAWVEEFAKEYSPEGSALRLELMAIGDDDFTKWLCKELKVSDVGAIPEDKAAKVVAKLESALAKYHAEVMAMEEAQRPEPEEFNPDSEVCPPPNDEIPF